MPSWSEVICRQQREEFWASKPYAYRLGYADCEEYTNHVMLDPINNEYDHQYNPYLTRSQKWDDYRDGCMQYYDDHRLELDTSDEREWFDFEEEERYVQIT